MTNDLIQFLHDRLNEDELAARDAAGDGGVWRYEPGLRAVFSTPVGIGDTLVDDFPAEGAHIARWDPDRVLAEVKVKREIIDRWETATYEERAALSWCLGQIMSIYSDHPDYRAEWRP